MAKVKDQVAELLNREMDRKQFLQYGAVFLLALSGISSLLQAILSSHKPTDQKQSSHGYGSSRYNR